MKIPFVKYQGTGNDFVMIDNRANQFELSVAEIEKLCDRKFGIGSDGVILLQHENGYDFRMEFFNPDGSKSFCGNGSRCAVNFARSIGMAGDQGEFIAIDGSHAFTYDTGIVKIRMRDMQGIEARGSDFILNTGSPHYIVYVLDLDLPDLVDEARKIRYNTEFSEVGINVNFVMEEAGAIRMRTYERGVEDETLSCGTGVTAAALSFALQHPELKRLLVKTRGGDLEVFFTNAGAGHFSDIWLCGPAQQVFTGEIETR